MPGHIPIVSRLGLAEYVQLLIAGSILLLEFLVRVVAVLFPSDLFFTLQDLARSHIFRERPASHPLLKCRDACDAIRFHGFTPESHYVTTPDGFVLGVQRILPPPSPSVDEPNWPDSDNDDPGPTPFNTVTNNTHPSHLLAPSRPNGTYSTSSLHTVADPNHGKPAVLLWHGFMMCSDVWIFNPNTRLNLPFVLAENGYDVWLGNSRGNKYAYKHVEKSPDEEAFWKHGMDDVAGTDVPAVVEHILQVTGQEQLTYIGFSQGTAQMFAALSLNPTLNQKVKLFIALAPVAKPSVLRSSLVSSLVQSTPNLLYLLFGRRACLKSVSFWQSTLDPPTLTRLIDASISFLFAWTSDNITPSDKHVLYPHLYSPASTKSVVHWFQIIRTGSFQMYDDEPGLMGSMARTHVPHRYALENVKTNVWMAYGSRDTLLDLEYLKRGLNGCAVEGYCMEGYEHLDMIWGRDVESELWPRVLERMKRG